MANPFQYLRQLSVDGSISRRFQIAVLEEAQNVASFSGATDVECGVANVQARLGRTFWDRAASAELDRRLAGLGDALPGDRSS